MKSNSKVQNYLHLVAKKLRQVECERARGNIALLESVEHATDAAILRKWGWLSTIVGAIFAFFVMPLAITIFQPFVPELFDKLLWLIAKLSMGFSLLMLAASIYFTVALSE